MTGPSTLSLIVAMDRGGVIGRNNQLPWRLPADLAFFKRTTTGHPVIMGRKTFESIGRPLPGRLNIIVTRNAGYTADGCVVVHSPEEALRAAGNAKAFVIGGAELYRFFLPLADTLHVTRIEESFEGDAFFPELSPADWRLVEQWEGVVDERNAHAHTFNRYERIR